MEASNGHHEATMPALAGSEARVIEPVHEPALPAPVVAAAGGAALGAVAYLLVRMLRRPMRSRGGAIRIGKRRGRRDLQITGSRSFLVDVHMLKR